MTTRALIGAAALGLIGAGVAWVVASRRGAGAGIPARPHSTAPYGKDILAALNWSPPQQNNGFVFQPFTPGAQPATVADGLGMFKQIAGQFGGFGMGNGMQSTGSTKPLLNMIGGLEAPQGYAQVYGGTRLAPPRPITQMSIQDVLDWQRQSIRAGSKSSAAGRFQVIRGTLQSAVRRGVVGANERYSPAVQDRIALDLANRRGLARYQSGQMSAPDFANSLAKEWASLPVVSGPKAGRSYYAGDGLNSALTSPQKVMAVLSMIKGA